jgi:ankyrin repeat protein
MGDIWKAAEAGDVGEVERLVEQDPRLLNARDEDDITPLLYAAAEGHLEVIRWLLDKGAAVNQQSGYEGGGTFWMACQDGCLPVVKLLLERGADPTIGLNCGYTPLMVACGRGRLEVVRLLLAHPVAKTTLDHIHPYTRRTALFSACRSGDGKIVKVLRERGADPSVVDRYGKTALDNAKDSAIYHHNQEGLRECVAALEVRIYVLLPVGTCPLRDCLRQVCAFSLDHGGRGRRRPTRCGRPGRWPTSTGAVRWR